MSEKRTVKVPVLLTPGMAARLDAYARQHRWSISNAAAALIEDGPARETARNPRQRAVSGSRHEREHDPADIRRDDDGSILITFGAGVTAATLRKALASVQRSLRITGGDARNRRVLCDGGSL